MSARRTPKTPQAEEAARKEILEVAGPLFEAHGFAKISLNDIARALGKTKGFLYYYFPDKESIFQASLDLKIQDVNAQLLVTLSREKTGFDKIRRYCLFLLETIQTATPSILQLREDIHSKQPSLLNSLMEMSNTMTRMKIPLLEELLEEGARDGSLPTHSRSEIHAFARVIAWTMQGLVYESLMGTPAPDYAPEESLRTILSLGECHARMDAAAQAAEGTGGRRSPERRA